MLFPNMSQCQPNQSKVVCTENKKTHIVENRSRFQIYKYQIDKGIIKDEAKIKCDYIVEVETNRLLIAFIIELKGSDVIHAIEQIENTISMFGSELQGYDIRPRIICSKNNTHKVNSSKERALRNKYKNTVIKENTYTDVV